MASACRVTLGRCSFVCSIDWHTSGVAPRVQYLDWPIDLNTTTQVTQVMAFFYHDCQSDCSYSIYCRKSLPYQIYTNWPKKPIPCAYVGKRILRNVYSRDTGQRGAIDSTSPSVRWLLALFSSSFSPQFHGMPCWDRSQRYRLWVYVYTVCAHRERSRVGSSQKVQITTHRATGHNHTPTNTH